MKLQQQQLRLLLQQEKKAINNLDEAAEAAETRAASTNAAQTIKKAANEADDDILCVQQRFEELTGRNLDFKGEISRKTDYNAEYLNMALNYNVDDAIMEITRKARYKKLMEIQQKISTERNKSFVGKIMPCIIECYSDNGEVIARTQYDAPEIDGVVTIKTHKQVVPGDIEMVKIIGSTEYDLIGDI